MVKLAYLRCDAELRAETARFAAALVDAEPVRHVPTCPAWTLADLAAHIGFGHRWAALIVERRATAPVPHQEVDDVTVPEGAEDRRRWLEAGAARLADSVREAGPETEVWSWAEDRTAGFWLRRLTHDTLVHRLDAELAVGRAVDVAADVAADCVSDLFDLFRVLPPIDDFPALQGLRGHGQRLHFHATDPGLGVAGEWLVRRTPSGVDWAHEHGRARVTVSGPAVQLLLVLSRRGALDPSKLEVTGDGTLLADWLEHSRLEPA